jgi:glutaredoxin 3
MIKKSGQMGVPVIMVDDQVIVGFNQSMLDKILGIGQPPPAPPPAQ